MNPTLALINRSTGYTADMGTNTGQAFQTGDFATDMGVNNQTIANNQQAAGPGTYNMAPSGPSYAQIAAQQAAQQAAAAEAQRVSALRARFGTEQGGIQTTAQTDVRDL